MHEPRSRGIRTALAILSVGLLGTLPSQGGEQVQERTMRHREAALAMKEGRQLTAEQAAALDAELQADPTAILKRIQFVGYLQQRGIRAAREDLTSQALWMIEHQPEWCFTSLCGISHPGSVAEYEKGRELWLAHLEREPDNATLVSHAAHFFMINELERAIPLLERGMELEPEHDLWAHRLSSAYTLDARDGDESSRIASADRAFKILHASYDRSSTDRREQKLADLAKAALAADEYELAEHFALQALDAASRLDAMYEGLAIYYGHWTLGLLSLRDDDVAAAKEHLLASADTPGAPTLNSFGPNMTLADQLVQRGQTEVVIEFCEKIGRFWTSPYAPLDTWIETLRRGDAPDFSRHLNY